MNERHRQATEDSKPRFHPLAAVMRPVVRK